MDDKPESGKPNRKAAISETRRRFLLMSGTFLGAGLTGCGYGFVPPKISPPGGTPLVLSMDQRMQRMLNFFATLHTSNTLQASFIQNPTQTLIAAGVVPPNSAVEINRANRLLLYTLGNRSLQDQLLGIVAQYPSVTQIGNKYTTNNVNLDTIHKFEDDLDANADFKPMFREEVSLFISDSNVRSILGLNLSPEQIPHFVDKLTDSMSDGLNPDNPQPVRPLLVVVNTFIALNINFKWNVNVNLNVNTNLNANLNVNYNMNANTQCNTSTNGRCKLEASDAGWEKFLTDLTSHAEQIYGG